MRKIILKGYICNNAITSSYQGNQSSNFNLLVSGKNSGGEKITYLYSCYYYHKNNKSLTSYLDKGKEVYIEGVPNIKEYKNKYGIKKSCISVTINHLEFIK